jgi:multidrug resistance efflux pump
MRSKRLTLLLTSVLGLAAAGSLFYMEILAWSADSQKDRSGADLKFTLPRFREVVCSGRVEAGRGEVDVTAQVAGQLAEVRVREGSFVDKGSILAVLEAGRQIAGLGIAEKSVQLAKVQLERLIAGNGDEEIAEALAAANAVKAELLYEERSLERARRLYSTRAVSQEDLDSRSQHALQLRHQLQSQQNRYQALRRGPLAGEIDVARAELALAEARLAKARVEYDYCLVRAPISGTILKLFLETGDSVSTTKFTPIARMADARDLRIRLEIDEGSVPLLRTGIEGALEVRGVCSKVGRVRVDTIVPLFGPKRLFSPDASERQDARTLTVLCKVQESRVALYPGQRVTARLELNGPALADGAGTAPIGAGSQPAQERE